MTLTFEFDIDRVRVNQRVKYLGYVVPVGRPKDGARVAPDAG